MHDADRTSQRAFAYFRRHVDLRRTSSALCRR